MKRLAIITTHPIQYYAPLFRLLNERNKIGIKVFYTWEKEAETYDVDFGREVKWDIDLLSGYDYRFVSNKGSPRRDFLGVKNPDLIKEIEEWKADAVLVFGWNYRSHLRVMRHFKNKLPVLFRGDSTLLDERPGWKKTARRIFLRRIYRHIDHGLYVGTNNREYFRAAGLREDQLFFAPHAIDNERFYDKEGQYAQEAGKIREELGVTRGEVLFTFVGKFQEKKDPLLLLQAFEGLGRTDAHLLLVGNGELEMALKEEALKKEAKGNKRIHFLPFQNQSKMPVVYRIGDVFCLPSKGPGETWGLAVNEAMACGRPVLVSDRCGCAVDLVVNGKNGAIFKSGDSEDLLDKLGRFLEEKDSLGSKGRESAAMIGEWSYEQCVPVIEKIVLNGKA